jgi:glycosyltransferase involved in cell wall biosynthesis
VGSHRLDIAWVTNVGAPYRHPVWAALAERSNLNVGLLADNEPNRQWSTELPLGVRRLRPRAIAAHRGEFHLYLLLAPLLRPSTDVLILPGWESPAAWQLLLEAKLRGVRTVAFYESSSGSHRFSSGPIALMRKRFFRSTDAVITVGAASRAAVLGFGVSPDRIIATQNTVDVASIHAGGQGGTLADAERTERFAYIGQLIQRKNVDGLVAAFALMPGSARLVIAGEGPEEGRLREQVEALGIDDRVDFRGYVSYDAVPAVLTEVSTLVLPSRSEVYGLVVTEALAAGVQVVVTDNCGVYADVRGLVGVFPAQPSATSLRTAMRLSAKAWTGPLEQPAILARTPAAMADDVLRACLVARSSR